MLANHIFRSAILRLPSPEIVSKLTLLLFRTRLKTDVSACYFLEFTCFVDLSEMLML